MTLNLLCDTCKILRFYHETPIKSALRIYTIYFLPLDQAISFTSKIIAKFILNFILKFVFLFQMHVTRTWWTWLLVMAALPAPLIAARHKHNDRDDQVSSNDSGDILFPRGRSPHDYGLRASPPLEIPAIVEPPSKIYDPRPKDINIELLKEKMGKTFDPKFMSINRPIHFRNNSLLQGHFDYDFPFRTNRRGRLLPREPEALPDWLRRLRFRYIWLPDGTKAKTTVSGAKLERKLQNYLWAHTSCPVVYTWHDFGRRFWPRWIKLGHCPSGKQSCSIPPGMTCQQASTEYKPILRWHCNNFEKAVRCQWIQIQYPIVTKCKCACPSEGSGYQ